MGDFLNERRQEYRDAPLVETELHDDPLTQFEAWYRTAQQTEVFDATAMTICTATPDGAPSGRMALLKAFDAEGFVFYTNYESRKAQELDANPRVALVFFWSQTHRQVGIEGRAQRVSEADSDAYFATRPRGSQLSAWASPQSQPIGRTELEARVAEVKARFGDGPIPRPPFWGGYRVIPEVITFWQGRPNRLHDRIRYVRQGDRWRHERLAP